MKWDVPKLLAKLSGLLSFYLCSGLFPGLQIVQPLLWYHHFPSVLFAIGFTLSLAGFLYLDKKRSTWGDIPFLYLNLMVAILYGSLLIVDLLDINVMPTPY